MPSLPAKPARSALAPGASASAASVFSLSAARLRRHFRRECDGARRPQFQNRGLVLADAGAGQRRVGAAAGQRLSRAVGHGQNRGRVGENHGRQVGFRLAGAAGRHRVVLDPDPVRPVVNVEDMLDEGVADVGQNQRGFCDAFAERNSPQ